MVIDEVDACLINSETRQELHTLLSRRLSNSYGTPEDEESMNSVPMKVIELSLTLPIHPPTY